MSANIPFADIEECNLVFEGKHWGVVLSDCQSYLGKCIVFLKNRATDDLMSLTNDEKRELWDVVMPKLVSALKHAFNPDRINYSHLANTIHHVHWHVVPRYEMPPIREFAGETFVDERVGRNYAPAPAKKIPDEMFVLIKHEIQRHL